MGYMTSYKLSMRNMYSNLSEIMSELNKEEYNELFYAVDEQGETLESSKWYEHENDLRKLSATCPGVVFHLQGSGEEAGDIWHKYFLNGKMQHCPAKIAFDEFDPKKLI